MRTSVWNRTCSATPACATANVIELKYLKRSERFQRGEPASAARVARAAQEAAAQVRRYVTDQRLARQYPGVRFTGLAVVYHGWELVHADAAAAAG